MIRGEAGEGPCIMLRADMDALPIQETATVPYKSQNPNVMHACGHDGHVSALLGAARVLNDHKDSMRGSIKLCFQPAEEGKNGAGAMIKDGILDDGMYGPRVDLLYGLHLWAFENSVLSIAVKDQMAASDKFEITVVVAEGDSCTIKVWMLLSSWLDHKFADRRFGVRSAAKGGVSVGKISELRTM